MKYAILTTLCYFVLGFSQYTIAQKWVDSLELKYRIGLDGNLSRGNVTRDLAVARSSMTMLYKWLGADMDSYYMYGETNRIKTENECNNLTYLYFFKHKRFYTYLQNLLETSERRKVDFRYQYGAGIGYYLIRKGTHKAKVNLTVLQDVTDYRKGFIAADPTVTLGKNESTFYHIRLRGNHAFLTNRLKLFYESWFMQSLQLSKNYRARTILSLEFPFSKRFSIRGSLDYSYENLVLQGRKQGDLISAIGIVLSN